MLRLICFRLSFQIYRFYRSLTSPPPRFQFKQIGANSMSVVTLRDVSKLLQALPNQTNQTKTMASQADKLANEIAQGIQSFGIVQHPKYGNIYAYEVDGFGNTNFMDDANVPSLLSLPYLGFCAKNDPLYLATRRFILSESNPYYSLIGFSRDEKMKAALPGGIGGPHIGTHACHFSFPCSFFFFSFPQFLFFSFSFLFFSFSLFLFFPFSFSFLFLFFSYSLFAFLLFLFNFLFLLLFLLLSLLLFLFPHF